MAADHTNRATPPPTAEQAQASASVEHAPRPATDRSPTSGASGTRFDAYLAAGPPRPEGHRWQEPDLKLPPGIHAEFSIGGGGGGGGGIGIRAGGDGDSASAGDSSGSGDASHGDAASGDQAGASGGHETGETDGASHTNGDATPHHATWEATPTSANDSAPSQPADARAPSLILAVAIPEPVTEAATGSADPPDPTNADATTQAEQPPDDTPPTDKSADQATAEPTASERMGLQPGARLVGIIPGREHGTEGQPGYRKEFSGVWQNPDGSEVHSHGARGIDADGVPYITIGGGGKVDPDASPADEGTGDANPEHATDSGEAAAQREPAGKEASAPGAITEQTTTTIPEVTVVGKLPQGSDSGAGKATAADDSGQAQADPPPAQPDDTGPHEPQPSGPPGASTQPTKTAPDSPPATETSIASDIVEGAVLGDYSDSASWGTVAGQTVAGFIPIWGQIADIRDIAHAIGDVAEGKDGAMVDLGINALAVVPGLDVLKGIGKVGKHADNAVKAAKHADIAGTGAKQAEKMSGAAKSTTAPKSPPADGKTPKQLDLFPPEVSAPPPKPSQGASGSKAHPSATSADKTGKTDKTDKGDKGGEKVSKKKQRARALQRKLDAERQLWFSEHRAFDRYVVATEKGRGFSPSLRAYFGDLVEHWGGPRKWDISHKDRPFVLTRPGEAGRVGVESRPWNRMRSAQERKLGQEAAEAGEFSRSTKKTK